MTSWSLGRPPHIVGGAGSAGSVGRLAAQWAAEGTSVLLVVDPGLESRGVGDALAETLEDAGLDPVLFTAFKADPTCEQADAGAALAREIGAEAVLAVGGGSALDIGKAVAGIARGELPAAAYALGAKPLPARPLRKVCVPTTAGTGSETTRTAVLTDAGGTKTWLWGDELRADAAVLDPELSVSLPRSLTAATGLDALVHAVEATTNRHASAANDTFAREAIRLVARWLPAAADDPADLEARSGMLLAAALAGVAIDNAGTSVAHCIGHAVGSLVPVHHGRAVAAAMLASLPWNTGADDPDRAADPRWDAVAELVGAGRGGAALAPWLRGLIERIGLDVALGEVRSLDPERLARQMAQPENAVMRRANRRPVTDDDLLTLARRTIELA